MRILALDLGDKWVGSAIADPLGITCRPLKTVPLDELGDYLTEVIKKEHVSTIVIGLPVTLSESGESEQTRKVIAMKEDLEAKYSQINGGTVTWVLWDERMSSKRAEELKGWSKRKDEKLRSHSVAASFILQSYLDHLALKRVDA